MVNKSTDEEYTGFKLCIVVRKKRHTFIVYPKINKKLKDHLQGAKEKVNSDNFGISSDKNKKVGCDELIKILFDVAVDCAFFSQFLLKKRMLFYVLSHLEILFVLTVVKSR